VRTRLTQLVPHVDHALSQLPAKAATPAQRLFAQSKLVVNRLQPPPPDSELSTQLEWTFKADVHSAAALSASIASTMADRERYALLIGKLFHVYAALEGSLDRSNSPAVKLMWEAHGPQLRRAELLAADLKEVDAWPPAPPSFETTCYLLAVREAATGDEAMGSARLLGHAYCRYAGGLLGEAALQSPYRKALGLASGSPKRLSFDLGITALKAGTTSTHEPLPSLERLYEAFDEAGEAAGTDDIRAGIVREAAAAMRCNLHLHQEGAPGFWERSSVGGSLTLGINTVRGLRRMAFGSPPPAAKPLPGPSSGAGVATEGRAKLVKLLGSYGPAFISESGLLATPTGGPAHVSAPVAAKPVPGVVFGAAREIVSAEHWQPLSFVLTEGERTENLYQRRMLTKQKQLEWKSEGVEGRGL
jgi:heme oxygenase